MADGAEDPRRGPLDTGTERYQKLKQTQVPRDEQEVPLEYQKLVEPHVASFNYFIGEGLQNVVESLQPVEVTHPTTGLVTRIWLSDVRVEKPVRDDVVGLRLGGGGGGASVANSRIMPRDCREGGTSYKGNLMATFNWCEGDGERCCIDRKLGGLPIMVRSDACNLSGMSRAELVAAKEEANEMGGYFICNGIERIIRCLVAQRRHYIMALRRGAYHKRGANYTDAATLIRCVRPDQSSATVRCHYLTDGTVNFAFTMRRAEYFIPAGVLLKCFLEVSDRELYGKLVSGSAPGGGAAAFAAERAELLLRQADRHDLRTKTQCIEYLGRHFRVVLEQPPSATDYEVGEALLAEYVFIHLDPARPADKLNLLVAMLHKLYALVCGACAEDNPDALTHHEILLPGHLLLKFMKEKLEDTLSITRELMKKDLEARPGTDVASAEYMAGLLKKLGDVGSKFEYLLNTGNLVSRSGLDLSQATGFTVVAEKLNFFRYLSHFRSVHRGAYFAELRTTTVRKLLPESWGFMCPVHTPDGAPCGLLNHFTAACSIVTQGSSNEELTSLGIMQVLTALGMSPAAPALSPPPPPDYLCVQLDGRVVGHVRSGAAAAALVARLRAIKASALEAYERGVPAEGVGLGAAEAEVPYHLEVVHVPPLLGGPFPGVFLFSQSARMIRPVVQLDSSKREMLGSLEQCFMSIRCPDGGHGGSPGLAFTHAELGAGAMLSVVASLTPYSDFNQSPRNMYQCQVTLIGTGGGRGGGGGELPQQANIRLRFNRNPMIGDKFASRHGQKGVLSILWPDTDMPFCAATGIRPDLIINPHAFPSRMTIGMLVESLVSKGGALAGQFVDASPFQRADGVEKGNATERWGAYLERQGFSRYGQETMISGVTGQEMPCDIYIGPVYYQRLRHMVSDKFQVRSTGPINAMTRQPIKGRKFGGGIRFGEMERDSLLAHGAAYLLHDRLHACSDYHVADVCVSCGSLLAPLRKPAANADVTSNLMLGGGGGEGGGKTVCPVCCPGSSATIERVALPYVFRFLAAELAAMNIKMELEIK
ncbi:hypothetical protein CHLRE_07g322176v5 [Chlamydomonas reinhardtii]|uniref:DNA-directed RNA polymerase subunit beta n=1 Tax=Chlamydomonas reinhardtii TaxID=3055 RepID=A0A2K3DJ39_CHLRE|nr:uncharacterized protein CHLRE_07g322176v5 [Chlamydomonas reinhardtii]PNW80548.1 hypothetical protein CHLRE_07g322176v5 [Chlamydomonas reinhardtii]